MVRLREIPRTAAFAWSPDPSKPLLITGTRAGAVDADFSDETKLELWDLNLDNQDQGLELQPIASISTDSRFYDLAWGPPDSDHPRGIIAGALENGSLDLWDAEKLIDGAEDAFMSRTTKHTGAIKSLQFNPLRPQILATAGAKGELFIYDVNDVENPFRLGTAAARADDLECVAWNRKVAHILATGGSGGFVTVWDLKTKKASLTLNNNRKPVSAIAWDPNNSTKLLTATYDDTAPVIFLWDLRNSNAPERTLQGHEQGILSLSWCQQDSDLLLSCGKDNRTLIWNPQTGDRYGEFPEVTNWTFLTRFNPSNPNLSATAGFDGKITIQTLQNTNPSNTQAATTNNLDGEDFFTSAQTQPQGASFSLNKAPKWLERPIGASFGFGGKLVIFKQNAQQRSTKISISQFSVDSSIGPATEKFEEALQSGDVVSLCESRKEQAKSEEEKADWLVMETLTAENPRKRIIEYLGFNEEEITNGVSSKDEDKTEDTSDEKKETKEGEKSDNLWGEGDGEGEEDFLSNLSANKGAKTDSPFHLLADTDTTVEKSITKALMLGNFAKATEISLKEERWADAFLIANCGGQELVDKVQSAYLASKDGVPSYVRLLGSVITKNLWDVVYNADLENWKESMAILCTFSDPKEFPDLCEALGDRILESGSRKDASFCFLVGSKLEKVVSIWITELEEAEQAGVQEPSDDSTFSVHARSLQHFIEKVTIFRQVTKFQDSGKDQSADWKLSALYEKYTEYADIIAAHGQLAVAQKYLDLLPKDYPQAELARSRLGRATQKGAAAQAAPKPVSGRRPGQPPVVSNQRATPAYQPTVPTPTPGSSNPYAPAAPSLVTPPAPAAPSNPYAPATPAIGGYTPAATQAPYAPAQGYQPPAAQPYQAPSGYGPPPNNFGAVPPPPRNSTPTSTFRPKESWNDVPLVARAPPSRKTTPSVAAITSPFPNQGSQPGPPQSPYGRTGSTPPPPPPKGPAPPRVTSPLAGPPQTFQGPPRPTSAASNAYTPPPPQPGAAPSMAPPPMPRTASPYNPAPSSAPPSNRYAPAPSAQPQASQPPLGSSMPPPGSQPPPRNPYAPPPQSNTPQNQYPPQSYGAPSAGAPPPAATSRPPTGPPPSSGPPPAGRAQPTPPPPKAAAAPPKPKHPAGDRSHIPAHAQRLVDVLSSDMQRVASRAPTSFAAQVKDTQKRLNLLFDHLNNEELVKPDTIDQLCALGEAIEQKNYEVAHRIQVEIQRDKTDECGNWMVGVKRLISMSKATP
ncbi:WD domain-containing protein [Colletotrichum higginsianum IMI 349063]|uniref:Protein transport protein SEC31 n=4 Tax=Colletotrichum higginsianum TaxID=80884 RepID=A0A1B7Y1Y5_COLHI|nr:WD domain-containing protein [Colletotrichum higginsianum IMI 349063]OBR06009.1 WD domain-containing protein [Colletotrichum higginsianum IMI 349063]TIC97547.1 Protein transport protein SEC31 [Colletotrichum higginsianum]